MITLKNIQGETSNNTFEFNSGDGHDVVEFDKGTQLLKFNNINKADVTLEKFGRNLLIKYTASDRVVIRGFYDTNSQAVQHYNLLFNGETNPTALSSFVSEYGEITAIEDTQNNYLSIGGTEYTDYIEFVGNETTHYNISTCDADEDDDGNDYVNVTVNGSTINTYDGDDTVEVTGSGNTINTGYEDDYIKVTGDNNTIKGGEDNDTIEVTGNGNNIYGADYCDLIKVTGNNNLIRSGNGDDDYADTVEVTGNNNTIYTGEDYDNIKVSGEGNLIHGGGNSDYITNDGKNCGNNTIFFGYNEQAYNAGGYDYYEYHDSGLDELEFDRGTQTLKFMSNTMDEIVLKQKGNDLRIHYSNSSSDAAVIKDYFDTTKTKATYILEDSTSATINLDTFVANYTDEIIQIENSSQSASQTISCYSYYKIDDPDKTYTIYGSDNDEHIIANVNNSTIYGDDGEAYYYNTGNDLIEVAGTNNTLYGEHRNGKSSLGQNDYFKNIDGKIADNTTIVFRGDDGTDTVDFKGGTQTLFFNNYSISFDKLNFVKDENDLLIRYTANSSVRILNYFDETITDKANYLVRRYKGSNDTVEDTITTLESLLEKNGVTDESFATIPVDKYTTTQTATSNLTGTDNADNIVITDGYENAQVYLDYDPFNISKPTYDYNNPDAYFQYKEPYTYEKDGNDLIIYHVGKAYNPALGQNQTTNGSIRVKDYFKTEFKNIKLAYEGSESSTYDIAEVIRKCVTFNIKGKSNSNNKLVGSKYSENFIGGNKNDTISTGGGDDIVSAGKGTDTINIDGYGDKTVVLKQGDGKTLIRGVDNSTSTNITAQEFDNYQICWSKSGKNIVLHFVNLDTLTSDNITISDYFREDGSVNDAVKERLKVNGEDFSTSAFGSFTQGKKIKSTDTPLTLIGTGKNDTITSNVGGDTIYAGNGNDTIYINAESETGGDSHVYTGKGKDKIIIKDSKYETPGTTYLHFKESEGNKTVVLAEKLENTNHSIYLCIEYDDNNYSVQEKKYRKSGDDLLIDFKFRHYDNKTNKYIYSTKTTTVQNYFTNSHSNMYLQENNSSANSINSLITSNGLDIDGKYNKKKKVTEFIGSDNQDRTTGTKKADFITTGAGDDHITPGKGNDTIYINGAGDKYIYTDKGDGADTIKLAEDVELGYIYLKNYDMPSESSYKIVKNDLIVYKTYADGDKFKIDSTRITGIKPINPDDQAEITRANIISSTGGLNISNKLRNDNNYLSTNATLTPYVMNEGKFKKANKIATEANTKNLVLGGKKNDTIILNGEDEVTYTSAGADNITANGNIAKIYAGSGNDTITLKSNNAILYGDKGNDTIIMEGNLTTGENPQPNSAILYTMYYTKGDGNDTIQIGDNFAGRFGINNYGYDYNSYIGTYGCYYSYQIDKNNNFVLYRTDCSLSNTSYNVDNFTTGSITVKGIKAANPDNPVTVTFDNIKNTDGGLNISGSFNSIDNYSTNMVMGNAKKANTLISNEGVNNLVLGGKKNDIVTVKGTNDNVFTGAGNDVITVENGSTGGAVVFTGSGNDTVNIDNCYSTAVYLGKGNNTVNVNSGQDGIYLTAGEGNNTFTFGDDFTSCNIRINNYVRYDNYGNFGLFKSGDDLLIKDNYRNAKNKIKTETQTIKNYFANAANLEDKIELRGYELSECINDYGLNVLGVYNKEQKATVFEGSEYKDRIVGTNKKDIISTKGGYDTITPGKGDDVITIDGSGTKNVYINNGDGNDTFEFAQTSTATLNLIMNSQDTFYINETANGVDITRIYDEKGATKTEKTSITKTAEQSVTINGTAISNMPNYQGFEQFEINKPNTSTVQGIIAIGGNKKDDITIIGEHTSVFAGKGNDKITVSQGNAAVTAGKGNDEIVINSTTSQQVGNVTINHAKGDGNDTVIFDGNNKATSLTINALSNISADTFNLNYFNENYAFKKHGNDLVFNIPTSTKAHETITLKDFFAQDSYIPTNVTFKLNSQIIGYNARLMIDSVYNSNTKTTTYDGVTNCKNIYKYSGKGKALINGENYNDYYIANLNKKTNLTISDKGNYDTMYLTASTKNLRAFFNVNSQGKVLVNENTNSDNFILFNKANLTAGNLTKVLQGNGVGAINIDNFFAQNNSSSTYTTGTGVIETIYTSANMAKNWQNKLLNKSNDVQTINQYTWINSIAESVSSWLVERGYNSTYDVLESNNSADIASLIKVYANVKCNVSTLT